MIDVKKKVYHGNIYPNVADKVIDEVSKQVGKEISAPVYRIVCEQVRTELEFQLQEEIYSLKDGT